MIAAGLFPLNNNNNINSVTGTQMGYVHLRKGTEPIVNLHDRE